MSNIRMLSRKEEGETDVEVSWTDQQQINQFSKLNSNIDELEDKQDKLKQEKEYLDDVAMELELADEDELVRHKVGDAFVHIPVSESLERVSQESEKINLELESVSNEMASVRDKMNDLKKSLYGRFGNAINLEKE